MIAILSILFAVTGEFTFDANDVDTGMANHYYFGYTGTVPYGPVSRDLTPGSREWYAPLDPYMYATNWYMKIDGKYLTYTNTGEKVKLNCSAILMEPHYVYHTGLDAGVWGFFHDFDLYERIAGSLPGTNYQSFEIIPGTDEPQGAAITTLLGEGPYSWKSWVPSDESPYVRTVDVTIEPVAYAKYDGRYLRADGDYVYLPKAVRTDENARTALYSSYEAYYERIAEMSFHWREDDPFYDDWGSTYWAELDFVPPAAYSNGLGRALAKRFRPEYPPTAVIEENRDWATNSIRYLPDTRRLVDGSNIASFVEHVRNLFPANVRVEPWSARGDTAGSRFFVFRPGGILDPIALAANDVWGSHVFLASSALPPKVVQTNRVEVKWYRGGVVSPETEYRRVEEYVVNAEPTGLLAPEFGWSADPRLSYDLSNFVYQVERTDWPLYAITLDMMQKSTTPRDYEFPPAFHTEIDVRKSPIAQLFDAVEKTAVAGGSLSSPIVPDDAGPLYRLGTTDAYKPNMTFLEYLTNAFPKSAMSRIDPSDSWKRCVDAAFGIDGTRRLLSDPLAVANQALAVMDRTIQIPSMFLVTTNDVINFSCTKNYEANSGIDFHLEWDGESFVVVQPDEYPIRVAGSAGWIEDRKIENVGYVEVSGGIRAYVSDTTSEFDSHKIPAPGETFGDVSFNFERDLQYIMTEGMELRIDWGIAGFDSVTISMTDMTGDTNIVVAVGDGPGDLSGFDFTAWLQADFSKEWTAEKFSVNGPDEMEGRKSLGGSFAFTLGPALPSFQHTSMYVPSASSLGSMKYAVLARYCDKGGKFGIYNHRFKWKCTLDDVRDQGDPFSLVKYMKDQITGSDSGVITTLQGELFDLIPLPENGDGGRRNPYEPDPADYFDYPDTVEFVIRGLPEFGIYDLEFSGGYEDPKIGIYYEGKYFEVFGTRYIRKNNGMIKSFIRYFHPVTGEMIERDEGSAPIHVGEYRVSGFWCDDRPELEWDRESYPDFDSISADMFFRIMTQVDWKFSSMNLDKGENQ